MSRDITNAISSVLVQKVLMHLLALGAFWRHPEGLGPPHRGLVLMHLLVLGAF